MKHTLLVALIAFPFFLVAQADTVIVELAKTSRLLFTMQDSTDLEQLREYDYSALFDDILHQLEVNNSSSNLAPDEAITVIAQEDGGEHDEDDASEHEEDWYEEEEDYEGEEDHYPCSQSYFLVFDFGINNYVSTASLQPADPLYSVRPWGSWYVGINAVEVVRLNDRISFEGRAGLSFYNFKFEENNIAVRKTSDYTTFEFDERPLRFLKSKLAMVHVNMSFVPVLSLGSNDHEHHRRFYRHRNDIRIGLGPYVGYRLDSYNKLVYEDDDENEIERNRSNFHLNNLRYGVRFQLGIRNADFFFQYDLNELFKDDKGPRLNAYAFGISF